jgi:hypothetical protein
MDESGPITAGRWRIFVGKKQTPKQRSQKVKKTDTTAILFCGSLVIFIVSILITIWGMPIYGFSDFLYFVYISLIGLTIFTLLLYIGYFPNVMDRHSLSNDDHQIVEIFIRAKNNGFVCAQGGEFSSETWEKPTTVAAIDDAIKRGVNIELIGGPYFDKNSKHLIELIKTGKITYHRVEERIDNYHFRFNDSNDILYHDGKNRTNKIMWYNNKFAIKAFKSLFSRNLANSKIIPGDNFLKFMTDNNNLKNLEKISIK